MASAAVTGAAEDWVGLAARARARRRWTTATLYAFLVLTALPVLVPYFWLFTISVSATSGSAETFVLWRAVAILAPAVFAFGALQIRFTERRPLIIGRLLIGGATLLALAVFVGPFLHEENYRFLWNPDIVEDLRGKSGAGGQFPWVWTAFANSLLLAGVHTLAVVTVATLAGYYASRFAFRGRALFLQSLLVLHAFPAITLIIPIFLIVYWVGLLDTIVGVVLVIVTLELPFSIFIMKGFFDAVPWDIEMSAMTDGASRRQAFVLVVVPQVKVGMLAIGIFAFLRGWEEYVFVRTLLFEKSNWVMSLYLFWVADDIMGVDYGIVAAVGVLYVLPSLLLFIFAQKYLVQMTVGGIKG